MPQSSRSVSPVEYSALPNTDDPAFPSRHHSLDQAEEHIHRTNTGDNVQRSPNPSQDSQRYDDPALPLGDHLSPLREQQQADVLEDLNDQSTSTHITLELSQTPKSDTHEPVHHFSASTIWHWVLGCCLLVVAALVGMIATIYNLDGKPIPHWPYCLSINTFIAAFSVTMKASSGVVLAEGISHIKWTKHSQTLRNFEMQDEASRGPWGALNLLKNDMGCSVSSLGAMVTILALFLKPFSQQLVSFIDCEQQRGGSLTIIPRANAYRSEGTFVMGSSSNLPWGLQNSISQGLSQPTSHKYVLTVIRATVSISSRSQLLHICIAFCTIVITTLASVMYRYLSRYL
jgi:hypothetical protein